MSQRVSPVETAAGERVRFRMAVGVSTVRPLLGSDQETARRFPQTASGMLLAAFLASLIFVNPWVRGDGVGYYAYVRALIVDHNLNFEPDWKNANPTFAAGRIDPNGQVRADQFSSTGHIENHFSIGPAILWAPFFAAAHGLVLVADRLGAHIPADGFSRPYRVAVGLATAFYGFLSLWLGYDLARRYVNQRWALLATFGIWFASSLPVYMYFNPTWSPALSAFSVALFLWYWDRTRGRRAWTGWATLGLLAGLMMNVYYPTAVLLVLPVMELAAASWRAGAETGEHVGQLLGRGLLFIGATSFALLPTLITKKIVYGSFFNLGYTERWYWYCPALLRVCFSADHGLFTWTPILLPAVAGLFLVARSNQWIGLGSLAIFLAYLYVIGCYQDWDGMSSFGNRFFVSLTPIFVLGLAAALQGAAKWFRDGARGYAGACAAVGLFVAWNLAFIFQWGMHIVPVRGPISWEKMVYNQVAVVPFNSGKALRDFVFRRQDLMQRIEDADRQEQRSQTGVALE